MAVNSTRSELCRSLITLPSKEALTKDRHLFVDLRLFLGYDLFRWDD